MLGQDQDERISAEELAGWADTISYEVYCLLGAANLGAYQGALRWRENPDSQEPSICLVCAWRENCVKKFSFTGQHCLEFTRDLTLKAKASGGSAEEGREMIVISKGEM